jgi:hypothetical protein
MNRMKIRDLILSIPNSLDFDFCDHVIQKFESDERKCQGTVLLDSGVIVDPNYKISTDLCISDLGEWKEEDGVFYESLQSGIKKYIDHCNSFNLELASCFYDQIHDTGYQIQRTKPGERYSWHHDWNYNELNGSRVFTYIWYLNDISRDGETEFIDGTKIKPQKGKLLFFPATWSYVHRGITPKFETKYICTGWIYKKIF